MTRRPRLLFLCQTLPYPPDGGVWIRTYHILRLLARAFDITALCFERAMPSDRNAARDTAHARQALSRFAAVEVFPIPQRHSRVRFVWDHARSIALRRVYTSYLYDSPSFRRRLAALLRSTPFDLVHVDSLDLAEYLPACAGLPVIGVHHDVESRLLARRAEVETGWRRAYLKYQAALRRDVERRWCERLALNVAVSEDDAALLKRIAPASAVSVVPNGVDVDEFHPDGHDGTGVAFVGGVTPFPNRDALDFFCGQILPHLRGAGMRVPVRWIGRASAGQRQVYGERWGVELTGYVEDARPFMRQAACHVVPLRVGGGTRLKILNGWAMGKAVVSTSLGREGLTALDGDNILIRDDPKDFARAVLEVLTDDDLRHRLGARGRATAERLYSWNVIGDPMIQTYMRVAGAASCEPESAIA